LFPNQGHWTEEEYLALDTNRLVELVDGFLEVLPMPMVFHQLIVKFLLKHLETFVAAHAAGLVLFAPLPGRLWAGQFREPDILFLRPGRVADVRRQPNAADLVMEVVSPGAEKRDRDLRIKRAEYARAGIAEYWIVDHEQQTITVLTLAGQVYQEHGVFGIGQQETSVLLKGFSVAVGDVFAAGEVASRTLWHKPRGLHARQRLLSRRGSHGVSQGRLDHHP
jgi:Uma2 family endonuclease